MGPIENNQEVYRSNHTMNDMPIKNEEEDLEQDDCFVKFGLISSAEEKNERINKRNQKEKTQIETNEDQPAHLAEEIDAITALIIYNTYSKKHEFTFSAQHRAKIATPSKTIRDDIDQFDAIYSCLIDQSASTRNNSVKKTNLLSNHLCRRFFSLSDIPTLKKFQQNEQLRIYEEKKANFNRVPFIPNILSYQRTCPQYNLDDMKWIRDHLC
ncbi:unnamed protein product [Adineta steineri]|uniref:Uncharacterized protein n=1 Tax=Adineta steineri TaxID=433720 RepID=A0A815KGV8_9BILA|nr:unnamed protein product [Adineta steineri]CAF4059646.1 unnamed protein product [Adineta steineri]